MCKKVVILEIGVGAEGLKKHVKQYQEEFTDVNLIRINPEFDASHGDAILQMRASGRAAILALGGNI